MTLLIKISRLLLLASLLLPAGCVKYSFRGALPSSIKTIAIPFFQDRSPSKWVGLQERLSEEVLNAFVRDNSLTVVDEESGPDLLISGTIISVRTQPVSISQDEAVEREQLVVIVKVDCLNQALEKPLWSGQLRDFGELSGSGGSDEIDLALEEAIEKIVAQIVDRTIAAW